MIFLLNFNDEEIYYTMIFVRDTSATLSIFIIIIYIFVHVIIDEDEGKKIEIKYVSFFF